VRVVLEALAGEGGVKIGVGVINLMAVGDKIDARPFGQVDAHVLLALGEYLADTAVYV